MKDTLPAAVSMLRDEFSSHVQSGKLEQFKPSIKASMEISSLTRDLETKRETGTITTEEQATVSSIDSLWEEIYKFNNSLAAKRPSVLTESPQTYDFKTSQFVEDKPMSTTIAPTVTSELADDIISNFEKQFQEVMGKTK